MLTAIAGPDRRSPIAIAEPAEVFAQPLERDFRGVKLGWSRDFAELPVDPATTAVIESQRGAFESIGCQIIDETPDWSDADDIFKAWRAWRFELQFAEHLRNDRDQLKQSIIWNAEEGQKLTGPQLSRLERKRTDLYHRVRTFMETHEFLVLPVSQVPPFDIKQRFIEEINGQRMATYIDWMKSCYYVTITGLPAISVPCGFTPAGLPVGVQIVGRHQDDFGVLQLAYAFQQATEVWKRRPGVAS